MQLSDTISVVTGGTRGIGRAIAESLARRGSRVVICGRDPNGIQAAVDRFAADGLTISGRTCDVRDAADITRFAADVVGDHGPVDILVNNAGLGHLAPLTDLTVEQLDEMFAVNVRGLMLMTKAFLPQMIARERGEVVNVASLAGRNGFAGGSGYGATKHAVLGFAKSLMLEVRSSNVRVISVCPGSVATEFFDAAGIALPNADRVLQPDDVADTVIAALELPGRASVSELDIRPTNP